MIDFRVCRCCIVSDQFSEFVINSNIQVSSSPGSAIAQAVSRWFPTAAVRVRARVW
jgi:hypothetical protein